MNLIFKLTKDLILLVITLALVAVAVIGVRLPYRSVFTAVGPYQLEAFPTGLAFFHYGRGETPFYNISPLNDYLVDSDGNRLSPLSQEDYDSKNFTAKFQPEKPWGIVDTAKAFFGQLTPWFKVETDDLTVSYQTTRFGNEVIITKTINFKKPQVVSAVESTTASALTIWYNSGDIVFDSQTGQAFMPVSEELVNQINKTYGFTVIPASEIVSEPLTNSGSVTIINPKLPGFLTIQAGFNQEVLINQQYHLVEVITPVVGRLGRLTSTITITSNQKRTIL